MLPAKCEMNTVGGERRGTGTAVGNAQGAAGDQCGGMHWKVGGDEGCTAEDAAFGVD